MMRLAADENFNGDILRGLRRETPAIDLVRIQDVDVYQADDPQVLAWASREARILLTHDRRTMPRYVYERISHGEHVAGVFIVSDQMPLGQAIDELLLLIGASNPDEWQDRVVFLPL